MDTLEYICFQLFVYRLVLVGFMYEDEKEHMEVYEQVLEEICGE